jgi:hypothetical protein
MKKLVAFTVFALICSPGLFAQNRMAVSSMQSRPAAPRTQNAPAVAPRQRFSTVVIGGHSHRRAFGRGAYLYGAPYFYSDFYEPYEEEYARPEPAPPPAPAPAAEKKSEPIPEPVLLELRGNDWVRVSSFSQTQPEQVSSAATSTSEAKKNLTPAILVYRDGHTEEVSSYSIISGVIYVKADYWSSGAWTKNIQIADLDVAATLRENQTRGVKFELPSSPNEVMLRP